MEVKWCIELFQGLFSTQPRDSESVCLCCIFLKQNFLSSQLQLFPAVCGKRNKIALGINQEDRDWQTSKFMKITTWRFWEEGEKEGCFPIDDWKPISNGNGEWCLCSEASLLPPPSTPFPPLKKGDETAFIWVCPDPIKIFLYVCISKQAKTTRVTGRWLKLFRKNWKEWRQPPNIALPIWML